MRSTLTILTCIALAVAAGPACTAAARLMVGLLPFEGPRDAFLLSVPVLIDWEDGFVPGKGMASAGVMSACIDLNKLTVPKDLHDRSGFHRLARDTGVDYLVAGRIERQDRSNMRFRVVVYSAKDAGFARERSFDCRIDELPATAVEAAKFMEASVGAPARRTTRFDTHRINAGALAKLEEALRAYPKSGGDMADLYRGSRLSDEASSMCPDSPALKAHALSFEGPSNETLHAYLALHSRVPGNTGVLHRTVTLCRAMGMPNHARQYTLEWLKLDPNSWSARVAAGQPVTVAPARSWQRQIGVADSYASAGRKDDAVKEIKRLNALYPENAYLWHEAGKLYHRYGMQAETIVAHDRAYRLNPDAFRLAMDRGWDLIRASQTEKAGAIATRAVKRWPKSSEAHNLMARVYEDRKQWDKATHEMETAARLCPDYMPYHRWLAGDYRRSGRPLGELRERLRYDDPARTALTVVLVVLGVGFLLALLILAVIICRVLRRDDPPKAVRQR